MAINIPISPKLNSSYRSPSDPVFSRNEIVVSPDLDKSRVRAHSTVGMDIKALSLVA